MNNNAQRKRLTERTFSAETMQAHLLAISSQDVSVLLHNGDAWPASTAATMTNDETSRRVLHYAEMRSRTRH